MYARRTGKSLPIRPVHLDLKRQKTMEIRSPFTMDPDRPLQDQIPELSRKVLQGIFDE